MPRIYLRKIGAFSIFAIASVKQFCTFSLSKTIWKAWNGYMNKALA